MNDIISVDHACLLLDIACIAGGTIGLEITQKKEVKLSLCTVFCWETTYMNNY